MIQRFIGILFTLATLAVIAFAILNHGNYHSICFDESAATVETPAIEAEAEIGVESEAEIEAEAEVIEEDTTIPFEAENETDIDVIASAEEPTPVVHEE
jgi:hypothetical protein